MEVKITGERIYPKKFNESFKDHRNRYYWAINYVKENAKILDLACGSGYGSFFLSENTSCKSVTALDISEEALKWAKKYFDSSKIEYICTDLSKNFTDILKDDIEKYDLITCFETIEHLENDDEFIARLKSLLNKDGVLLISSPCEDVIPFNENPFFNNGQNPFHYRHYTYDQFVELIEKANLYVYEEFTQYEDIVQGRGLATNILVCGLDKGLHKKISGVDYLIQSLNKLKFNQKFNFSLPTFNRLDMQLSQLINSNIYFDSALNIIENNLYVDNPKLFLSYMDYVNNDLNPEKSFLYGLYYFGINEEDKALKYFNEILDIKTLNSSYLQEEIVILAKKYIEKINLD